MENHLLGSVGALAGLMGVFSLSRAFAVGVSWVFRRVSPVLLVPADTGQHRCPWWRATCLVLSLVSAVRDLAGPLSPIAGRGRSEPRAALEIFFGGYAKPRRRYEPGGELGRGEFPQALR